MIFSDKSVFCLWVPYTSKEGNLIISVINSRVQNPTYKYGIEVPTYVEHANGFDEDNWNRDWLDDINK